MAATRIMPLHVGKGRTESRAISDIIDYAAKPHIHFAGYGILISPMVLPLAAIWLLGKVQSLKSAIQELVYG